MWARFEYLNPFWCFFVMYPTQTVRCSLFLLSYYCIDTVFASDIISLIVHWVAVYGMAWYGVAWHGMVWRGIDDKYIISVLRDGFQWFSSFPSVSAIHHKLQLKYNCSTKMDFTDFLLQFLMSFNVVYSIMTLCFESTQISPNCIWMCCTSCRVVRFFLLTMKWNEKKIRPILWFVVLSCMNVCIIVSMCVSNFLTNLIYSIVW